MTIHNQSATGGAIKFTDFYKSTRKQAIAWKVSQHRRFLLYGGARGGGKSYFLRWRMLHYLLDLYGRGISNAQAGLFCSTYPELQLRQVSKIEEEFPRWLGTLKETKTHGLAFHLQRDYGGGVLLLRNLDNPDKYKSAEFAGIAIDELTMIPRETFNVVRGSLRWKGVPRPIFIAATNPGGIGHAWVKEYWIDRIFPPEMKALAKEFAFVRALPSDNPHLEPSYWDDLNTLPEALVRAWVHGDWDVFEGQAFPLLPSQVIKPFTIPSHWPRKMGIDSGKAAPYCCLWAAFDPKYTNRVIIYRESYEKGLTDIDQANVMANLTSEDEQIRDAFGDPSMWTKKDVDGKVTSSAEQIEEIWKNRGFDVPLWRADNNRLQGKRKVDRLFMDAGDGRPGLLIFRTCTNLVRTLPALPYDKVRVEDIDTDAEDHPYDGLRYLLTDMRVKVEDDKEKNTKLNPWTRNRR